MSCQQEHILFPDFPEIKFQLSEMKYHLESAQLAMQEAMYHLKKMEYHASLAKDVNKIFIL